MKLHFPEINWRTAIRSLKLTEDEVHIWRADLQISASQLADLWRTLDKDEQRRAKRFKFAVHRQRFIAAKGILKKILGQYLNVSPQKIQFSYGEYGKPFLGKQFNSDLTFNNSGSNDLAVYAIAHHRQVGIDVEHINKTVDHSGIVERFFSAEEIRVFQQLPKAQQKTAFFNGWVQKEAFVKAIGAGLSFHLHQFDINLKPDKPAKLIAIAGDKKTAKNWQLITFEPAPNFVACLAVEGKIKRLNYLNFENTSLSLPRKN